MEWEIKRKDRRERWREKEERKRMVRDCGGKGSASLSFFFTLLHIMLKNQ